jgi:Leucine-rich repeat (LRR) protein
VPAGTPIYVKFNENIDCSGVSFSISPVIRGTLRCDGDTFNFSHPVELARGTRYATTLSGVTDLAGNRMKSSFEWAFTIELRITDIEFASEGLESCITNTGYTYPEEIQILECVSKGIIDLSGMEHFTNLRRLVLNYNNISDLTPLLGLDLSELLLRDNFVTDLTQLSGFSSLFRLDLGDNSITNVSPLGALTNLMDLTLSDNSITQVAPLGQLTNLSNLALYGNNIVDVTALSSLTSLTHLYLQNNWITTGVTELVTLINASVIHLFGNNDIPCADLDVLDAVLGAGVVTRPNICQ